jgi:signal transduction histidine kinase
MMTTQLHPVLGVHHHETTHRPFVPTLTQRLAHELGDSLTVVVGYARLVSHHPGIDDEVRRDIEEIVSAAERSAALVHSLQAARDADLDRGAA